LVTKRLKSLLQEIYFFNGVNMFQFTMNHKSDTGTLNLEGDLSIEHAAELKEGLVRALTSVDHIIIKLDKALGFHLSAIQLLCSACKTAMRQKKLVTLAGNMPDELKRTAEQAGFSQHKRCIPNNENCCFWD